MTPLLVFVGGGLGSLARYFLSKYIQETFLSRLPHGTLVVNILASLTLGIFVGLTTAKIIQNPNYRLLVVVGFCGGFSTFSTFANDTLLLINSQEWIHALLNILLNVVLCLFFTAIGIFITKPFI
jgi:fluoride exporter